MATLAQLRARLNGEIGVVTDGETTPWSTTTRNNAIIDGYAALWRVGVWKHTVQTIATVDDQWVYSLSSIRRLERIEILDSSSRVLGRPAGIVQDTGSGAWELRLQNPVTAGYSLRVRGWTAYKSQFASDSDTDDLPVEHVRVPLLKAKAILYRAALGSFMRYRERQALPPEMSNSPEQLLAGVAAAEREFLEEARALSNQRPRSSQIVRL